MRLALLALTAMLAAAPAYASGSFMSEQEINAAPRLYGINLGTNWEQFQKSSEPGAGLAAHALKSTCGSDSYFVIHSRYNNDFTGKSQAEFFSTVSTETIETDLRKRYYPAAEVSAVTPAARTPLGNTEAFHGVYRLRFADGKRQQLWYYLTYSAGYIIEIYAYATPRERLLAESCFTPLFETFRLRETTQP